MEHTVFDFLGVRLIFISQEERQKHVFHKWQSHEWKYHFWCSCVKLKSILHWLSQIFCFFYVLQLH